MPRTLILKCFALIAGFTIWPAAANAQECSPPTIKANAKIYNIFSPDQEIDRDQSRA